MIISPDASRLIRKYMVRKPPVRILMDARRAWRNAISANRWRAR